MPKHISSRTKIVTVRLPNAIYDTLQKRVKEGRGHNQTISGYLRDRITYDVGRKHKRSK